MALHVITPAQARRYLERLTPRRNPIDPAKVNELAGLMQAGKFYPDGPVAREGYRAVAVNERGELASGRHRMQAIVQSGRTVAVDVANWGDWPDGGVR